MERISNIYKGGDCEREREKNLTSLSWTRSSCREKGLSSFTDLSDISGASIGNRSSRLLDRLFSLSSDGVISRAADGLADSKTKFK